MRPTEVPGEDRSRPRQDDDDRRRKAPRGDRHVEEQNWQQAAQHQPDRALFNVAPLFDAEGAPVLDRGLRRLHSPAVLSSRD